MIIGKSSSFIAQARPYIGWKTVYTAKGGESISYIHIANVGEEACNYSICLAPIGKGYHKKYALMWSEALAAHNNDAEGYYIPLTQGMRVGVMCDVEGCCTFTVHGSTIE